MLVTNAQVTAVDALAVRAPEGRRAPRGRAARAVARHRVRGCARSRSRSSSAARRATCSTRSSFVRRPRRSVLTYLQERAGNFPGVDARAELHPPLSARALAAQLLGYVGQISPGQLKTLAEGGYQPGDEIGQSGVESAFNTYLQGIDGSARVRVDSSRPSAQPADAHHAAADRADRAPDARHRPPARRAERARSTGSSSPTTTASGQPTAARSSRSNRRTARSSRSPPRRRTTRPSTAGA